MSQLPGGLWIGIVVNATGDSAIFKLNLAVKGDGSITGDVIGEEQTRTKGKPAATIEGRFSPHGTLHLRYTGADSQFALFDGYFDTPDENHSIFWGSILLSDKRSSQQAGASFHFVKKAPKTRGQVEKLNGHVWGG